MEVGSNMVLVYTRQAYEIGGAWFLKIGDEGPGGRSGGTPMQPENLCLVYRSLSEGRCLIVSYVECGQGRPHSSSNCSDCRRNKTNQQKLSDEK